MFQGLLLAHDFGLVENIVAPGQSFDVAVSVSIVEQLLQGIEHKVCLHGAADPLAHDVLPLVLTQTHGHLVLL